MKQRKCPSCQAPLLAHEARCPNCNAKVQPVKRKGPRCACDACGAKFRAEGALPGAWVDCPNCGQQVQAPRSDKTIRASTQLASKRSRPRKKLGPGWDVTWDGLDRLYFHGSLAGLALLGWLTCIVVLTFVVFLPIMTGFLWIWYMMLAGLGSFIMYYALHSDQDLRLWGAFVALGVLVAIPIAGVLVAAVVFLIGFLILCFTLLMAGIRLLKCLVIPAESHARPFIVGSVLLLLLGLGFFAGAFVQAALNITSLRDPAGIPYLEEILLSGVLMIILANCLFSLFLRLISAFMEDPAINETVTGYVIFVFGFAVIALILTGLLHSGVLQGEGIGMDQMGPNIARIIFLALVGIDVYLLLKSISASRDAIGYHLRIT
jgi:hypothetical protein